MKSRIILSFVILIISAISVNGQNNNKKNYPEGTWKFEAPYAPEGYQSGVIVVGKEEKKNTTTMSFTGTDFKIPGERVKNQNDSLLFSVFLEGQDINIYLKLENDTAMSGIAVYSEGEVPLNLTKTVVEE
jgi:hypothetical protein